MSLVNFRKARYEKMSADELFWEIGTKEEMDALDEAYWDAAIAALEFTKEDLRDIAAQCMRRTVYVNNT